MKGLITDRTQQNVARVKELSAKGWNRMTTAEKAEWSGNPYESSTANLFPPGPYYASSVDMKYRNESVFATATAEGTYLYAVSILGKASYFENKTLTLSADRILFERGTPQVALYWHDNNGFEYAGATLLVGGIGFTVNTAEWPNTNKREYLAAYVYVTTHEVVTPGTRAEFVGLMLALNAEKQPYVPYAEILPTPCTKGAYNYSDLNRVERAVAEISDRAGMNLSTKTDWQAWDVPTVADMERYLSNIQKVYDAIPDKDGVPAPPLSMENLTYSVANNIENILLAGYESLSV